jgi:hypothetical protein
MAQFKAFDSKVEISGQAVLGFVAALDWNKSIALEILSRHGIDNPQAQEWYSQQALLDAYQEIAENMGAHTLYQMGIKVPENAIRPPGMDSLEQGLALLDIAYHVNHRGGEIGSYKLEKLENNQAVMFCHNPYPCDFDRGLIVGVVRNFAGGAVVVTEKHAEGTGCRKLGGESCTYILEWVLFKERKN